jgi:hypothetical protein
MIGNRLLNCSTLLSDEGVVDIFNCLIIHDDDSFFGLVHYFLKTVLDDGVRFEFLGFDGGEAAYEPGDDGEVDDGHDVGGVDFVEAIRV